MNKLCQPCVINLSMPVLPAKYAFLRETNRLHALRAALICIAGASLCLATLIALFMAALRRHDISMGRAGA